VPGLSSYDGLIVYVLLTLSNFINAGSDALDNSLVVMVTFEPSLSWGVGNYKVYVSIYLIVGFNKFVLKKGALLTTTTLNLNCLSAYILLTVP
jgi:hypothetical protein